MQIVFINTDNNEDYLVTGKIIAVFQGGAYTTINGIIQSGGQLNVSFNNGSNKSVTLVKIQLNDAANGAESNNILSGEVEVKAGDSKNLQFQ